MPGCDPQVYRRDLRWWHEFLLNTEDQSFKRNQGGLKHRKLDLKSEQDKSVSIQYCDTAANKVMCIYRKTKTNLILKNYLVDVHLGGGIPYIDHKTWSSCVINPQIMALMI